MQPKISSQIIALLIISFLINSCGLLKKTQEGFPFSILTESKDFPMPVGYVNDFEDILTDAQEKQLTKIIKRHEKATTDQIAVLTIRSIETNKDLKDYTLNVANYWGVGQKNKDNGTMIALGKNLREIRIQNGSGIINRLSDAETKQIIDKIMIPEFKKDNYFQGLKKGIEAIIEKLQA